MANPISIACPHCGAEPLQRCRYVQRTLPKVHKKRQDAATEAAAYERLAERIVATFAALTPDERAELARGLETP